MVGRKGVDARFAQVVPQKSMLDIPYGEDLSEEWDGHDLIGRKVRLNPIEAILVQ